MSPPSRDRKRRTGHPARAEPGRPRLDIPGVDPLAALPTAAERGAVLGMLIRFVSCGILSLTFGAIWRLTLAPARVGIGTALLGILALLLGFVVGGILWYIRDVRLRRRHPERVGDERIIFSFVVFALMPFAVGVLVGLIWLITLLLGGV